MRYQGGKKRLANELSAVIQTIESDMGIEGAFYWEPFAGMCSVLGKMGTDQLGTALTKETNASISRYTRSYDNSRSRSQSSRNQSYDDDSNDDDGDSDYYEDSRGSSSRKSRGSRKSQSNVDRPRFASDANENVMLLLDAAANKGWKPPTRVSEREFDRLKAEKRPSALRGFVGAACSFQSNFFSGFAEKYDKGVNYAARGARSLAKSVPALQGVHFRGGDYRAFARPSGGIIYCDIPYQKSAKGKPNRLFLNFDYDAFWDTMRDWSRDNLVFISEEVAPKDFMCVWAKEYTRNTNQRKFTKKYTDRGEKAPVVHTVEKLFIYKHPPSRRAFDSKRPRYPWTPKKGRSRSSKK